MTATLRHGIEGVAVAIEMLAVAIMVAFVVVGTVRWLVQSRHDMAQAYQRYRLILGKSLLLGLELLVAADIIRTVTLDATLESVATLGALVVVRTALGWALAVEVEGRWPWQAGARDEATPANEAVRRGERDRG